MTLLLAATRSRRVGSAPGASAAAAPPAPPSPTLIEIPGVTAAGGGCRGGVAAARASRDGARGLRPSVLRHAGCAGARVGRRPDAKPCGVAAERVDRPQKVHLAVVVRAGRSPRDDRRVGAQLARREDEVGRQRQRRLAAELPAAAATAAPAAALAAALAAGGGRSAVRRSAHACGRGEPRGERSALRGVDARGRRRRTLVGARTTREETPRRARRRRPPWPRCRHRRRRLYRGRPASGGVRSRRRADCLDPYTWTARARRGPRRRRRLATPTTAGPPAGARARATLEPPNGRACGRAARASSQSA